jgi:hypothetical protein
VLCSGSPYCYTHGIWQAMLPAMLEVRTTTRWSRRSYTTKWQTSILLSWWIVLPLDIAGRTTSTYRGDTTVRRM